MALIDASFVLSHVEGVSDSARARELYKYYQPTQDVNSDTCFPSTAESPGSTRTASIASAHEEAIPEDPPAVPDLRSNVTSSKISSPDTALTAFCQLVSWRIGAQRAMISLIDAQTQYFVAESTKTVDLVDNTKHAPGDSIWLGCTSVSKTGRLCERTLEAKSTHPEAGEYPSFIVNDLSTDRRFNQLPFVTEPPSLRFYAGVPLITKRGIPIGSLFVVDSRVRNGLPKDEIHFMGTMARTIMRHLEMVREVEEHRRGMKMSRGLASFVEGRAELAEAEADVEEGEGTTIAGQFEEAAITRSQSLSPKHRSIKSNVGSVRSIERKEKRYSAALGETERKILIASQETTTALSRHPLKDHNPRPTSLGGTETSISSGIENPVPELPSPPIDASEASSMKILFARAANLIREAFEVDGGAVFYDAQRGFSSDTRTSPTVASPRNVNQMDSHTSGEELHSSRESSQERSDRDHKRSGHPPRKPDSPGLGEYTSSRKSSAEAKNIVKILGFSTPDASSIHGDDYPGPHHFQPFDEKALHTLLRRYPRGKLWTFDSDGGVSSSGEDDLFKSPAGDTVQRRKEIKLKKVRSARMKSDAMFLSRHFPGVRQLLFVPLWDASRGRWLSGCFAWSTEPTRILSKQNELAFLSAFGNSVMAECSRIDTEIADQKKGDFIGSISHELRSPLHGILASAEFLSEEDLSGFERGLVETIDSCGRTLLDTINHILDFSKINHFEKTWRKNKRSGVIRPLSRASSGGLALRQSDMPMINLFADVDISVICEEVVEGVFAGHVFQNVTAPSFDMVPGSRGKMSDPKALGSTPAEQMMGPEALQDSQVNVILDVDMQDYKFITQPGAVRRVIMNLLGNALKYTSHGYVRLKLEATEMGDLELPGSGETIPRCMVVLTVTDTGRGISSEFLRSKLFTPFAQENSLSSGTGLGLSIVRSIVALLEGEITIDSDIGRGTQVRVTLPLLREMPKQTDSSGSTPKSVASLPRDADESVSRLQSMVVGQKCSLHGFYLETSDPVLQNMAQLLKASITNFLTNWYGFQVVPLGTKGTSIVISNEAKPDEISKLTKLRYGSQRKAPSILVLCSHSSRFDRNLSQSDTHHCKVSFVAKPVGPVKLARAIMQCLDGAPSAGTTPGPDLPIVGESNDLSNVFEELSMSPHGREMLDNSRMAADSENARKAIESPTPNALQERKAEFPFPAPDGGRPNIAKSHSMPSNPEGLRFVASTSTPLDHALRPQGSKSPTKTRDQFITASRPVPAVVTPTSPTSIPPATFPSPLTSPTRVPSAPTAFLPTPHLPTSYHTPPLPSPRLLLVDDNKINLTLLRTYMRKRKYSIVDEAENGLDAVAKVEARKEGYDVIFMDISMPVLDGFGATRRIRGIERGRRGVPNASEGSVDPAGSTGAGIKFDEGEAEQSTAETARIKAPALIIALTGLASSTDQSEAFSSGIDLFLTKPVAFKEVGKLLDNWEANREREWVVAHSAGVVGGTEGGVGGAEGVGLE